MSATNLTRFDPPDLTKAFRVWCKTHGVTPSRLAKETGWSYTHSWGLTTGRLKFGYHSFGLFLCAYGLGAFEEILELAEVTLPIKPGVDDEYR